MLFDHDISFLRTKFRKRNVLRHAFCVRLRELWMGKSNLASYWYSFIFAT